MPAPQFVHLIRERWEEKMTDAAEALARAYVTLLAIRTNMPPGLDVPAAYVDEYHNALQHLEQVGCDFCDVSEFRTSAHLTGRRYLRRIEAFPWCSEDPIVDRGMIMARLSAALRCCHLLVNQKPNPFRLTDK